MSRSLLNKTTLCCWIFLLASLIAFGQGENNIWYFGNGAGLDFNSGDPVALTDGNLWTLEGCATVSDTGGNLLFYTNGISVWSKDHNVMANGTDLNGERSSSQSAIIVPKPMDPNIFYVFTTDAQGEENGLQYSEVDISMNDGLGEVTVKNTPLTTPTSEKLTAVRHQNNVYIWVLVHAYDSDSILAFLVTPNGVNSTPVASQAGSFITGGPGGTQAYQGCLKASPDGRRLAIAHGRLSVQLFDFNTTTGRVSNTVTLKEECAIGDCRYYGVEFSPNGQYLYVNSGGNNNGVFQYNVNATDPLSSEIFIANCNLCESMQLGPDNKIYVAKQGSYELDVINTPNNEGIDCGYSVDDLYLAGRHSQGGLPQKVQIRLEPIDSVITVEATEIYIPNSFTPNNDGINDVFAPQTDMIFSAYSLTIFNRWGEVVFESDDINDSWDGKLQQQGVYSYVISATVLGGSSKQYSGNINLIK